MPYGYEGTYVSIGPPGTGKTTWLARQVSEIVRKAAAYRVGGESPVIVASLTRTAAAEAAGRNLDIPDAAVATLHAHSYRAMGSPAVADADAIEDFNRRHPGIALSAAYVARNNAFNNTSDDLKNARTAIEPGDEWAEEYDLLRHRMTPREQWPHAVLRFAETWEAWKREAGVVDFTDMIEHAPDDPPLNPGVVLCDEAQDCSALELDLLQRWGQSAGALILVGDPYQSLYEWRGAAPDRLLEIADENRRRVLSQSHRIPKAVHKAATRWVARLSNYRAIEYQPKDEEGEATWLPGGLYDLEPAIDEARRCYCEGESVMLITATNRQANSVAKALRDDPLPFANPWRKAQSLWNPIRSGRETTTHAIRAFIEPPLVHGRLWTYGELERWQRIVRQKATLQRGAKGEVTHKAKHQPDDEASFGDLIDWIEADAFDPLYETAFSETLTLEEKATWMADWLDPRLSGAKGTAAIYPLSLVRKWGVEVLSTPPTIYVGTIHSFKGGEADVAIVFPELSHAAWQDWIDGKPHWDGIVRAYYVAMTRAKRKLCLMESAYERRKVWQ